MLEIGETRAFGGGWLSFMTGLEWEHPLGTRHDPTAHRDWKALAALDRRDFDNRPDRDDRGNAAFCDGHVEYIPRSYTWQRKNYYPLGPAFLPDRLIRPVAPSRRPLIHATPMPFRIYWRRFSGNLRSPPGGVRMFILRFFCASAAVVAAAASPGARGGELVFLGDLLSGGNFLATDVSGDASVVVGVIPSPAGPLGFRWTREGGVQLLPAPRRGEVDYAAHAISRDGRVIVGAGATYASGPGRSEALRWLPDGTVQQLGDLPGGTFLSSAFDASDDGSVVVGQSGIDGPTTLGQPTAFRWTPATGMSDVGRLPGLPDNFRFWSASGVSGDGSVVVGRGAGAGDTMHAYRWTADRGAVSLGDLPGGVVWSEAYAVSRDGSAVVGFSESDRGRELFRWTEAGGMVGLGVLPGPGRPLGIALGRTSDDASVIVGSFVYDGVDDWIEPFIYDPVHGLRYLELVLRNGGVLFGDTKLVEAVAVSADGRTLVGTVEFPNRSRQSFITTLDSSQVPEPAAAVPLAAAAALLARRRRRLPRG